MSQKSQNSAELTVDAVTTSRRPCGFKLGITTFIPIALLLLLLSYLDGAAAMAHKEYPGSQAVKGCGTLVVRPVLPEVIELEERELLQDTRTSFIPPDLVVTSDTCKTHAQPSIEESDEDNTVTDYDYEDTDDLVVPVRRRLRRTLNITDYDFDEASSSDSADEDGGVGELVWTTTKGTESPIRARESETTTPLPGQMKNFWKNEENFENIRNAQAQVMKSHMDTSINPCDDFYQYACGNWERNNQIPQDKAAFDTFEMLRENLDSVLRELLLEPIKPPTPPSVGEAVSNTLDNRQLESNLRRRIVKRKAVLNKLIIRHQRRQDKKFKRHVSVNPDDDAEIKAKHLFMSCINYEGLAKRGLQPLHDLLDSMGGWPVLSPTWREENFDWLNLTAQLRLYNNDIFIVEWVGPDIKNSEENVIQFDQTSLGLPTRDYFLLATNKVSLDAYRDYMVTIINLLGADLAKATQAANEIIDFEVQLANITSTPEDRSNVTILYKRTTLEQLHNDIPQIDWHRYLEIVLERPIKMTETVVIFANEYMESLVQLIAKTEPRTIANYLLWRFVRHRVNNLDDRFLEAKQKFYFVLFGREKSPPRWKICVNQVNSNLGMAVGAMFVRKYFDENSKKDTLVMTHELQQAFREILNETEWIDPQTKFLAELKVNAMSLKIGYPDFILSKEELNKKYKDLDIHPDRYFENTLNVLRHLTRTEQLKLGQLVNKTLWNTAPAVVNAYYSRNKNQIMFPAGILQPPFYHRYFPKSLNFGGIGVVIGHELTHGFDDKGRLFDREGNLHRWWSDFAIDSFHERAKCLIQQYGNYTVAEVGQNIDGENTQGENIADNGGIKQAFRAYKHWLAYQVHQPEVLALEQLPGLNATNTQLFFLNFAQVWCGAMRKEAQKNKLKTAVHSPGKFRVIGTLSNSEDFAREYNCPVGSAMNPKNKCIVW